jgi:SAM-dependent methyltransferase
MFGKSAASLYDRCPAPDYSAVLRWIDRVAPRPGRACDVGCGTGSLMLHLSPIGWQVEGCDPSSAMVRAARGKNPGARVVRAGTGDFRPSAGAVDLITATFDVVNHLPSRIAMRSFFRRARGFLTPGGVLVFDSVTPDDIDRNWRGYVEVDRPRGALLVRTGERLAPDRGALTYEIFRRRPDGAWDLEVERHELRSASSDWFRGQLLRAGFANVQFVDAVTLRAPTWRTVRWLVAARVPRRASTPAPRAPARSTPARARRLP